MQLLGITPQLTIYIIFITVLTGLVMGSFSNCLAERLESGENFINTRSHCNKCGHTLGILELIPVFSWLFLKGKCKYCKAKISARYPITELVSALLFVVVVLNFDVTPKTFEYLILTVLLMTLSLVDLDTGIIPDGILVCGIANYIVFTFFESGSILQNFLHGLIGGLSISLPLLIFVLIYDKILKKDGMGGGDIKLFFVVGLYFSWKVNLFMLILSCIIGILFYFVFVKIKSKKGKDTAFPFGPSIAVAAFVAILYGNGFIDFYTKLFY